MHAKMKEHCLSEELRMAVWREGIRCFRNTVGLIGDDIQTPREGVVPACYSVIQYPEYFLCPCCTNIILVKDTFRCGYIVPTKRGGTTEIANLMPICERCYVGIGAENVLEFKRQKFGNTWTPAFEHILAQSIWAEKLK